MVKNVKSLACTVLLILAALVVLAIMGNIEHTYTRQATVTQRQGDTVTVVDTQGNEWNYTVTDTDTTRQGNTVTLTMHDNNTDSTVTDDTITRVHRH